MEKQALAPCRFQGALPLPPEAKEDRWQPVEDQPQLLQLQHNPAEAPWERPPCTY